MRTAPVVRLPLLSPCVPCFEELCAEPCVGERNPSCVSHARVPILAPGPRELVVHIHKYARAPARPST
eukprot:9627253-Alexandrium_andersonii.AAC.1